jgi:hypothetical protein
LLSAPKLLMRMIKLSTPGLSPKRKQNVLRPLMLMTKLSIPGLSPKRRSVLNLPMQMIRLFTHGLFLRRNEHVIADTYAQVRLEKKTVNHHKIFG